MKLTKNELRKLILKEFKISKDYEHLFDTPSSGGLPPVNVPGNNDGGGGGGNCFPNKLIFKLINDYKFSKNTYVDLSGNTKLVKFRMRQGSETMTGFHSAVLSIPLNVSSPTPVDLTDSLQVKFEIDLTANCNTDTIDYSLAYHDTSEGDLMLLDMGIVSCKNQAEVDNLYEVVTSYGKLMDSVTVATINQLVNKGVATPFN